MTAIRYTIHVTRSAEKALLAVPKRDQARLIQLIQSLALNPFPVGSRKLQGELNTFRVRTGQYRVIYEVDGKSILIVILKIGHRKDIYR